MTYVLSDIHGHLQRFESVLEQIKLKDSDTLYILGDVIDRHPYGIDILKKIINMPNVHMLLGNHEYMMMRALGFPYDGKTDTYGIPQSDLYAQWYINGGGITNLEWNITEEKEQDKIKEYLKALPLNYNIEVNGKKFKLIHAAAEEWYVDKGGIFETKTYFAVWERNTEFYAPQTDCTVIFGHTPTVNYQKKDPLEIWYYNNLIGIDCACGYINPADVSDEDRVNGRLACLRLEDMKEFYSEDDESYE